MRYEQRTEGMRARALREMRGIGRTSRNTLPPGDRGAPGRPPSVPPGDRRAAGRPPSVPPFGAPSASATTRATPRQLDVRLVRPTLAILDAAVDDEAALGRLLGCSVAPGWDVFPGALRRARDAVAADTAGTRWGTRLFVLAEPRTLVGLGGFKGPPRDGAVELGYAIAPGYEGRGLATAAVHALLAEAFADAQVRAVVAHTLPERNASVRVLEKAGFTLEGEVPDEGVGTAWRHRRRR
jgi:[ribosomal protein S5]-alanine N-acetyltransferase